MGECAQFDIENRRGMDLYFIFNFIKSINWDYDAYAVLTLCNNAREVGKEEGATRITLG